MRFYETSIFTSQIVDLISDESYAELQAALVINPEVGDLIQRSRGLRKIRWRLSGKGKSGGIRIIYFLVQKQEVFFLYAYPKGKRENITAEQTQILRGLVDQHLKTNE